MKIKQNKGITLIALVITIIILLILAGVTIATLTGENGILNQAQGAKTKSEIADIEEKIKLALMASRLNADNTATIDLEILEEELKKSLGEGVVIEKIGLNDTLPWNVSKDKYKYKITEQGEVIKIMGITLSQSQLKLIAGQGPVTLTAVLSEGIERKINWSSSNPSVATVDSGVVTLVSSKGTTEILASVTSGGVTYEAKCTVIIMQEFEIIEEKIKLAVNTSQKVPGQPETIDLGILQEELRKNLVDGYTVEKKGNNSSLPWRIVKDKYIYEITEQGEVIRITGITLSQTQLVLMAGGNSETLTASLIGGIEGTIIWSSSNSNIVSVNGGVIEAKANQGTAIITASVVDNGKTYEARCSVSIMQKVTSISVKDMEIEKGSSAQLEVTINPSADNVEELTYTSSNTSIATVDNNGKVTVSQNAAIGSTVTITVAGKVSTNVKGTCTVKIIKTFVTAQEIASNPKEYYGKQVVNYKASETDTNVYRIFYVDSENYFGDGANTVYLKADYHGSVTCSTTYDANKTRVKQMNPLWAAQRGESSWNTNEKAAAWLCDPTKWTTYYNENYANYAIGGPSVEMYVKSYNQAFKDDTNEYVLGATYRATSNPGYIYTLNGKQSTISNNDYYTGENSLNYTKYYSMYAGKNGSKNGYWLLASPSSYESIVVCNVSGAYARLSGNNYDNATGVSPLISLRSDFTIQIEL